MIRIGSIVPVFLRKVCVAGVPPDTFLQELIRFRLIIFYSITGGEPADAVKFVSNCRSIRECVVILG